MVAVAAGSNAIPAIGDLLACLDLTGGGDTVVAIHTKKNQPELHQACMRLPRNDVTVPLTTRGHGFMTVA